MTAVGPLGCRLTACDLRSNQLHAIALEGAVALATLLLSFNPLGGVDALGSLGGGGGSFGGGFELHLGSAHLTAVPHEVSTRCVALCTPPP